MLNHAHLRGYVADEPYIRATERDKMAQLRVATIERVIVKRDGTWREHTEWHSVTLWGELAEEVDRRVRIGDAVEVEGALRTREWEDNKGKLHRTTTISATQLRIIEGGIEGYPLPRQIVERTKELYPQKAKETPAKGEITPPAADPDELPF